MTQRSAPIFIPVTAEDFARRRRRIVWSCIGVAALILLIGGWIYKRSTDPLRAREAYDAGQRLLRDQRYTQAILSFDLAVSLNSKLAEAYLQRGRAHVIMGDLEPATADFTKVIQLHPTDPQGYLERGAVYMSQQNYSAVAADCASAIAQDPKLAPAYNLRGAALRAVGETSKALAEFTRAVELSPDADNYFQRGATYQVLEQHQQAVADLDQVIAFRPDSSEAYFARARSKRALGDAAGATSDYNQGRLLDNR